MKVIRGKAALVTGAASGIGRAIALRLADEGARVFLLDVNQDNLEDAAAAVRSRGAEAVARVCDVSVPAQVSASIRHACEALGGVDILVNNAGITYYGKTRCMAAEQWDRLLAINLRAPIQFTCELLPLMVGRGEGHVLNVASICGLVGLARVAAYTTSKFGLVGFSESLRHELGRSGVGVTALCPGFVDTRLFSSAPHGNDRSDAKLPPRWTLITPERVANRAIRAIYRNDGMVVMQATSRMLYFVKRFAPWLLDAVHRVRRPQKLQSEPAEQRRAA
jgi:NAD(P)-dependent dehydrogenase (short-subunit alcohol dehydrogenase family)